MNINVKLKGSCVSKIKCSQYFCIKRDDKEIEMEEFIKELKNNNKTTFTHDMLKNQVYLYRGKELRYEELFNSKVGNLETAKNNRRFCNFELRLDKKIYYLLCLIDTLDRYINKARYELIKSSNIIDIDYLNSDINDHSYDYYYFQRCFNAENAIYSYYSTFEILMQIIWIYKEYYKGTNLNRVLESYKLKSLQYKLNEEKSPIINEFFLVENHKYSVLPKFKKVRNWCNKFKHRGILRFDGEEFDNEPTIKISYTKEYKEKTGISDFSSADFKYEYIDLDNNVIPELINYHNEILKSSIKVISNINLK